MRERMLVLSNLSVSSLCAAISYRKGASVCDLGSYVNVYPVVLALLGMRVTTVDYYPQASPNSPHYNPNIQKALNIYRSVGIQVIGSDLYELTFPSESLMSLPLLRHLSIFGTLPSQ
jgi:hypothetical protein